MSEEFKPAIGKHCLLNGERVLYVGISSGDRPHVFEHDNGIIKQYASLDNFEQIDEEYEKIERVCFKEIMVSNTTTMHEAIKKLYDAGMLIMPDTKG